MKKILSIFTCLITGFVMAQHAPEDVLMTINGESVLKDEFAYIFKKNNSDSTISKEDLDEYLDLFIKFKLKVAEAERLGLHQDSMFIEELAGYRAQLAKPYLTDSELTDALVQEAYDRIVNEVRASHILLKLPKDASPEDTLKVYQKILEIKKELKNEKNNFETIAKKYSEDPSVKDNAGDLGYFKAFQMVYPFEEAAYNLAVGEISNPVRTSFGYHLVKVTGKRKNPGSIKLSHIMVSTFGFDEEKKQTSKDKIDEIYQKLQDGEAFESLARKFSDDKSTASKGGEMKWISAGRMVLEFEEQAFALQENGDFSEPFQTEYGWHIVRRDDFKPIETFEQLEPVLKRKIARDVRSTTTERSFIDKKKKQYQFKLYKGTLNKLSKVLDSSFFKSETAIPDGLDTSKKLHRLDGKVYPLADYINWLKTNAEEIPTPANWKLWNEKQFSQYIDETVMTLADKNLERDYPEFKALMKEYRDGILLFEITDSVVWSKASSDSAGLAQFYQANTDKYQWNKRMNGIVYRCANEKLANQVIALAKDSVSQKEILSGLNQESSLAVKAQSGKFEYEHNDILPAAFTWEPGISGPYKVQDEFVVVHAEEILPAETKKLKEIKGKVTADYQDQLMEEWVAELQNRFTVEVNNEVLYSVK